MEQWQIALAGLRWLGNNKRQFVIDRTGRWEHFLFVAWKSHSWLTYAGGRWTLSIITFIDHKRMNERNKKNIRKNPMEINSFVVCLLAYFRGGETNSFACLGDWRVSEKSKKKQKKADELSNGWNEKSLRICVFSHSTGIFAWFFSPIATNMSLSSHSAALLSDHHFRMAPKISRTWCKHLMYGKKKQQTAGRRTGKNNNCRTLNRERGDVRLQCIHCM